MKSDVNFKRIVVKIGTSILTDKHNHLDADLIANIVRQIGVLMDCGKQVIVVSSGAIGCGLDTLNLSKRPSDLSELAALASIGQISLMQAYQDAFKQIGKNCAQVLLTWDDFSSRKRFLNAKKTINQLYKYQTVAIINENDSVSMEEIKFGDNDKLSALVATLVSCDLLIVLTDVDGLQDRKSNQLIEYVEKIDSKIMSLACTSTKFSCVGGMFSKLEAIKIANESGIPAVLANGRTDNILIDIVEGKNPGTFFCAGNKRLARKNWIANSARPKGVIIVDDGAKTAIKSKNKSLLGVGIVNVHGEFKENDVVFIADSSNKNFAKGITRFSSSHVVHIKGKKGEREIIHRDDLVII
jgi:glutamate 5-kinase